MILNFNVEKKVKEMKLFTKRNKKANAILDSAFIIVALISFGMLSVIGWSIWNEFSPEIRTEINTPEANATMDVVDNNFIPLMDGGFMFVFIGLWVFAIIASFMIDTHPIFFVISLILLITILAASAFLSNMYVEFMEDPSYSGYVTAFPITNFILSNLLIVTIIIGASIMLALYAKVKMQ